MAACANAVPDSAAPMSQRKKPMQSNAMPEVIHPRLTSNGGREMELLIVVLLECIGLAMDFVLSSSSLCDHDITPVG